MIKKIIRKRIPIIIILIASFLLNIINIGIQNYGNEYYAAGIKSMLTSFKNFFFLSFDPSGFVTLNKMPIGLWIQGIFAKILGFSGFSIILPQAIAGTICVLILYVLVKRYFGVMSAIVASLILAITPIFVAASRTNDFQTLFILCIMLSIMPAIKAARTGKLKYLIISFIIIGISFNISGLESFIILPAVYLTYILSETMDSKKKVERYVYGITFITEERRRIYLKDKVKNLVVATMILLVVSFSWSFLVGLIPASNRPYVGGSTTNSEIELVLNHYNSHNFKYNTNLDYKGDSTLNYNGLTLNKDTLIQNYNAWNTIHKNYTSPLGIFKLFGDNNITDQISWFLPLAIIAVIISIINKRKFIRLNSTKNIVSLFFSIWFITEFLYFSFNYSNIYALASFAVPISAMCGIGIKKMIDNYKNNSKVWILLALTLNIILQYVIVIYYRDNLSNFMRRFFYLDLGISMLAIIVLYNIRKKTYTNDNLKNGLIAISIIGCLVIPLIGSIASLAYQTDGAIKGAGLQLFQTQNQKNINNYMKNYGTEFGGKEDITKLVNFLQSNKGKNQEYLLVTPSTRYAQDIILSTGDKVMALGGETGDDNIISLFAFKQLVKEGKIKYVLVGNQTQSLNNASIMGWVESVGTVIDNNKWQDQNVTVTNNILYNVLKIDKRDTLYELSQQDIT